MKLLTNNEECFRAIDFIESCKVKVSSIKHIACKWFVCKPVHKIDIMYLSVGDSVEYGNLRDDINLRVDSYSRLCSSELRPSENGQAEINRCGVNRIESSMQLFKVPLRKELGYLRKNIVTRMHIYSNFDLDANVRISKVRQGFLNLCNCA